eukprot:6042713-Pyramimonas_sp.AAC.1
MGPRSVVPKFIGGRTRKAAAGAVGAVAFGGAPNGATERVSGVPTWLWGTHAGDGTGAFANRVR